jgi:integrase
MSRRPFGTVRERAGRHQARYLDSTGKEHVATFPTAKAADAWLAAQRTDRARGDYVDERKGRVSLASYSRTWLDQRSDLRPSTRGKYEQLLRLHICPELGALDVNRLAPSTVRGWYLALHGRHRVTADDAYRLLRAILSTAVADGALAVSPCKVKGAGQVRSSERPTATLAELAAAVDAMPEEYRAAILCCAWCQLRRGEVLGLQRRDLDLLHGTVRIERAWVPPPGGKALIGPPKTEKGRRTLSIPSQVLPALAGHLERFTGPGADAWLFPGPAGDPINPRTLERHWERARLAAGRPDLHLHDLRHSGLTWAEMSGVVTDASFSKVRDHRPAGSLCVLTPCGA